MIFLSRRALVVVETEDDAFLGMAELQGDVLVMRSGYAGRPTVIAVEDVERVTPAAEHPDIEGA